MASQHSTTADFSSRYKFNAKELDKETGWYYYGARYYDPQVSIWLSVDPLAEKYIGFSPYNFTLGNPVRLVDVDGKKNEDWIRNKKTDEYVWDENVTKPSQTPKGFEYVGPSLNDVKRHFKDRHPILSIYHHPKMGKNRTPWSGEIQAHENTIFENARDFGIKHNIPFSEATYNTADDVSVFITSFYLLSYKGDPIHLDGTIVARGSSEHIETGISGFYTIVPLPKFNIRGYNMVQLNKLFKGTRVNKLKPYVKGKVLKMFNYMRKFIYTPKKIINNSLSSFKKASSEIDQ